MTAKWKISISVFCDFGFYCTFEPINIKTFQASQTELAIYQLQILVMSLLAKNLRDLKLYFLS